MAAYQKFNLFLMDEVTNKNCFTILHNYWTNLLAVCLKSDPN